MIGNGLEVKTKLLFSRSHPPQADEGKKELPYWLSMCCQGLSEEFLNNFALLLSQNKYKITKVIVQLHTTIK